MTATDITAVAALTLSLVNSPPLQGWLERRRRARADELSSYMQAWNDSRDPDEIVGCLDAWYGQERDVKRYLRRQRRRRLTRRGAP